MPAAAYYPGSALHGDASNHFGPNPAAVEGLLADAGFARADASPWTTSNEWAVRAEGDRLRGEPASGVCAQLARRPRSGRMVFHAHAGGAGAAHPHTGANSVNNSRPSAATASGIRPRPLPV